MGLYTSIRLLPQIEPYLYDLHLGLSIPILIGPHTNKHIYLWIPSTITRFGGDFKMWILITPAKKKESGMEKWNGKQ